VAAGPCVTNLPRLVLVRCRLAVLAAVFVVAASMAGLSYVHRRLRSERVEYEESGGVLTARVVEEAPGVRQQDLLVALA